MPRWGDICVDGWATRFAESAQMSKSSATKIYATAAAALAVKEFCQKILEPTTCAFNPQNILLGVLGCSSIWVKWWRSFWFSIKNPIFWILQMTLKMKSYSREKNMKGDYNVSSISHFKFQWSLKYQTGLCIAFVKISCVLFSDRLFQDSGQ